MVERRYRGAFLPCGGLLLGDSSIQGVLFAERFDRPLLARFDRPHASSDGGAILLKAADGAKTANPIDQLRKLS